jgi:hypothetical protein
MQESLNYLMKGKLNRLNDTCLKYTNFTTFEELLTTTNYRPVLYYDQSLSNSVRRDLNELADAYDDYMQRQDDVRRVYRQ